MASTAFAPPACEPEDARVFSDVPTSHPACAWIEQMHADGLTAGCASNPLSFCPDDTLRRDQVAMLVVKAYHALELAMCPSFADTAIACDDVPVGCISIRPDCCGPEPRKWVFSSSIGTTGDTVATCNNLSLPGCTTPLEAADAICQHAAFQAGLSGTYRAWLSTEAEGPAARFTHSAAPYCRVDKVIVANDWADLTDCTPSCLDAAINVTETGSVAAATVWSRTETDGQPRFFTLSDCAGWADDNGAVFGETGLTGATDSSWTETPALPCSTTLGLYCFEQ